MQLFKRFIMLASLFTISSAQSAHAERIQSMALDLGRAETIYLGPGLISVIQFPEDVTEVSVGAPQIIKAVISTVHPEEIFLQVNDSRPFHTNMIVRTVKGTFVFDLKPSLSKHQDLIQITGSFGAPKLREPKFKSKYGRHLRILEGATD